MKRMLTFDDVCLLPYYNNVDSRLEPTLETWLSSRIKMKTPIVAANMESVIGQNLAEVLISRGSIPIFHRFTTPDEIVRFVNIFEGQCFVSC